MAGRFERGAGAKVPQSAALHGEAAFKPTLTGAAKGGRRGPQRSRADVPLGRECQPWLLLLAEGNPIDVVDIKTIVDAGNDMDCARERVLSTAELSELKDIFATMDS